LALDFKSLASRFREERQLTAVFKGSRRGVENLI